MANWEEGDTALLALIHNYASSPGVPTGWTGIGNGSYTTAGGGNSIGFRVCYRILEGIETDAGIPTWGGSVPYWGGLIAIYRGLDPTTPIESFTPAAHNGGGGILNWAPINPTADSDNWIVAVGWHNNGAIVQSTPPSGLTHRAHGNAVDGMGIHDSNGGTSGWAGGLLDFATGGVGARQTIQLKAASGESIEFVNTFYSSGSGRTTPIALPAQDALEDVTFGVIIG